VDFETLLQCYLELKRNGAHAQDAVGLIESELENPGPLSGADVARVRTAISKSPCVSEALADEVFKIASRHDEFRGLFAAHAARLITGEKDPNR
jgi:hypothetical protein